MTAFLAGQERTLQLTVRRSMRKGTKEFFIKIPIPGPHGDETDMVAIDPTRLGLNVLLTIFELPKATPGSSRAYKPAFGVETQVKRDLDPASILEEYTELRDTIRDSLSAIGAQGERIYALCFEKEHLATLVTALAQQDLNQAVATMRDLMYVQMSALAEIASDLQKSSVAAEHLSDTLEAVAHTLDKETGLVSDLYTDWAVATEAVCKRRYQLETHEKSLRGRLHRIEQAQTEWRAALNPSSPSLSKTLEFFEGSTGGDEGFIAHTYTFRGEPTQRTRMQALVQRAEEYMQGYEIMERALQAAWRQVGQQIQDEVLPLKSSVEHECEALASATEAFNQKRSMAGAKALRPHETQGRLVTENAYTQAEETVEDPHWGRLTTRERMAGLITSILSLRGPIPKLPEELASAIRYARERISAVNEYLGESVVTKAVAVSAPASQVAAPEPEDTEDVADSGPTVAQTTNGQANPERAQELYELILCVGYHQTILKKPPLSVTNPRAALNILMHLGKCTREEKDSYCPSLHERCMQESEAFANTDSTFFRAQKTSRQPWIRAQQVNKDSKRAKQLWLFKLTHAFRPEAERLFKKYQLTTEGVQQAYLLKREAQIARHRSRKSRSDDD